MKTPIIIAFLLAPMLSAQAITPNTEFRVRLLSPISTQTNQKGDKLTTQVLSPETFQGAFMEGFIRESKSSGKVKGKSILSFTFDKLIKGDDITPIRGDVQSMINSKGQQNVDDEGRVIKKTNNIGKVAAVAGAGAIIGALAGGARGAAIGAGAGAAAGLILTKLAVRGENVTFNSGSEFVVSASPAHR